MGGKIHFTLCHIIVVRKLFLHRAKYNPANVMRHEYFYVFFMTGKTSTLSNLILGKNFEGFCTISNSVLSSMIEWFSANKLVLNIEKTNIMKFITNNSPQCSLTIGYKDIYIEEN
jgi:hypothetical protein